MNEMKGEHILMNERIENEFSDDHSLLVVEYKMARSQEKAHTMMNKWVTAKQRMRLGQT